MTMAPSYTLLSILPAGSGWKQSPNGCRTKKLRRCWRSGAAIICKAPWSDWQRRRGRSSSRARPGLSCRQKRARSPDEFVALRLVLVAETVETLLHLFHLAFKAVDILFAAS